MLVGRGADRLRMDADDLVSWNWINSGAKIMHVVCCILFAPIVIPWSMG